MKNKLFKWLDETFNDFYSYLDEVSGEMRVIEHLPNTGNEQMWKLLNLFNPAIFSEDTAVYIKSMVIDGTFIVEYGRNMCGHIVIKPYDNYLYHTSIGEENNGEH